MSEAESFFLADVSDVHHVRNIADDFQQVQLLALFEHFLEFVADVKMVLDRLLAAPGDDDDLITSGHHGFFDAVLNDGLVDERKHFFWLGLGGRKESRAETGGRKNSFADFHGHGFNSQSNGPDTAAPAAIVTCARS